MIEKGYYNIGCGAGGTFGIVISFMIHAVYNLCTE